MIGRYADIGVAHVGMGGDLLRGKANIANNLQARCTGRNNKHRLTGNQWGFRIGHGHHDEEVGIAGVG
ncbi:hypothetical protein D3C78_1861350 [compost metagenome]